MLFDQLQTRLEYLLANPDRDSEAARHDALVLPFLTDAVGLGWNTLDLVPQENIAVPNSITDGLIFRDSIPKKRIPDLLIRPVDNDIVVAAIEEKEGQRDLQKLNDNHLQLREYQALCECTWGILTDGEKWIVKRNFESWGEFHSIQELRNNIEELRNAIGRQTVIARINAQGSPDLLFLQSGIALPPYSNPQSQDDFNVESLTNIWQVQLPDEDRVTLFKQWASIYLPQQIKQIQKELVRRGNIPKEVALFSLWMDHARESFLAVNEVIQP